MEEEKFTGCLLGVAAGDALGQPVEAYPPERIVKDFGEVRDFMPGDPRLPIPLGAGQWTDGESTEKSWTLLSSPKLACYTRLSARNTKGRIVPDQFATISPR